MPFIKNAILLVGKSYTPQPIVIGKLAGGLFHTVYVNELGRARGWGFNIAGQLGDTSNLTKRTPVSVRGATKTFCQIAAGGCHTVAIDKNGRAWAWGEGNAGQLGNNATTSRVTPVSVAGATKTFCKISTGECHTVAIDKNGQAWAWGYNFFGQLGNNSTTARITPVSICGATKTFCEIEAGVYHTVAIDKNGRAWAWGYNTTDNLPTGQLGDNSTASRRTPVSVAGATKTFCKINGGNGHTVAIDKNGRAWAWGYNAFGQLGDNTITSRLTPVSVAGATKTFCEISAGLIHTVAIDKNGQVWAWGDNSYGQLGNGENTTGSSRRTPVSVAGATKTFCKISAGSCHTVAIDKMGRIWAWGANQFGQVGDNSETSKRTPVSVRGATKTFCQLNGGFGSGRFIAVIDKNGQAWAWGINSSGQLGDNSTASRRTPVSVAGATKTFCQIVYGNGHTVAIDKNGRAWAWGNNEHGQLGDNTTSSKRTPVSVIGATKTFCQISAGSFFSLAIDINGQVWTWGQNNYGQLGDNTFTSKITPISIVGATKTFCKIAGGQCHTVAIDKNGRAWAWGYNGFGQLGDNSTTYYATPISVLGTSKTFCQLAVGACHTVAIDKNGRAWGWGNGSFGQIGNNTELTIIRTPVSVVGATKTFCQIKTGLCHTVAIDKNGRAWSWGTNNVGQLGDNTTSARRTPVSVVGTTKTFCQIAAQADYTIAIDKNGQAWGWGYNVNGQLGDDSGNKFSPTRVCNL